jgi:hypothetical protein
MMSMERYMLSDIPNASVRCAAKEASPVCCSAPGYAREGPCFNRNLLVPAYFPHFVVTVSGVL